MILSKRKFLLAAIAFSTAVGGLAIGGQKAEAGTTSRTVGPVRITITCHRSDLMPRLPVIGVATFDAGMNGGVISEVSGIMSSSLGGAELIGDRYVVSPRNKVTFREVFFGIKTPIDWVQIEGDFSTTTPQGTRTYDMPLQGVRAICN